jgi:hypothetical protein
MASTFVQSAVILLREGLEALLILAALAAYLIKADARDRLPALYAGALLAIAASLITAWLFEVFNNGAHSDLFEAFVILAAAALMLYVSGWLLLRQDPKAWQRYLHEKADAALARRTGFAVGARASTRWQKPRAASVSNCGLGWQRQRPLWSYCSSSSTSWRGAFRCGRCSSSLRHFCSSWR